MTYKRIDELPNKIRFNLPKQAQEIFMETFNSAWEKYKTPKKESNLREKIANKEAWSAVKKKYEKNIKLW